MHSRKPSTDSSVDTTKVPLGVSMSFVVVIAGIWVRGYLQEEKCFNDSSIIKAE